MRATTILRTITLFLPFTFAAVAFAQFHDPTPDELKMTADPKAPGAAAVYLNYEDITNDQLHWRSIYARIKVLQEKGKDLATVEVPYYKGFRNVVAIKGRTIHPDGTIVPLAGKPEDLLIAKKGLDQLDKKVFNLPSVEVGSILEYSYQINTDDNYQSSPSWDVQQPYFIHQAHYAFTPWKGFLKGPQGETSMYLINYRGVVQDTLIAMSILPPGVAPKTDTIGRYSLDLTDIPASPDEEYMPPVKSILYQVNFYYKDSSSPEQYWTDEIKYWSKQVDHFAEPSKPIHDAVAGIVAPTDTDLVKAQKIYKAVQALENTSFTRTKDKAELKQLGLKEAKRAEDTWTQKSGTRQDITLLYLAMLRAAGLQAYDMKVVNRDRSIFFPGYLYFGQFDDDLVIAKIDGKEMILDPGEKMCPFQTVHWKHSAASGIRQSSDDNTAATVPYSPYAANSLFRSADLTLDPHGNVSGTLHFVMGGQEALRWRQEALKSDPDEVKKSFDRWLAESVPDGVQAHIDQFQALDDPYQKLSAEIKVEGSLGSATSKRLLLPGFFFETRGSHPFVNQEKRVEPVDMEYGAVITDQVIFHLPAGLGVESAPLEAKTAWEGRAALTVKERTDPTQVTLARQLVRGFTIVKPEEYQDLRGFYQKVAASDQQQLILVASAPAKGN